MDRKMGKLSGLALVLVLAITGAVQAQQQQHRGSTQTSQGQTSGASQEAPASMLQQMQGMMADMHDMMQQMQGMMGRRSGMMTEANDDDEDDTSGDMMGMMGRRGGMMGHGHMLLRQLDRLAAQLHLTEEQQTQMRSLARDHMKEAIRAKADIAAQRVDLIALLDTESVDLPKVKETLQSLASQQADLVFTHVTLMDEINKLLTPEQQQQFRTMRRPMMHGGGMMGMMGRGGMHGHGRMMGQGGMRGQGGMMGRGTGSQ